MQALRLGCLTPAAAQTIWPNPRPTCRVVLGHHLHFHCWSCWTASGERMQPGYLRRTHPLLHNSNTWPRARSQRQKRKSTEFRLSTCPASSILPFELTYCSFPKYYYINPWKMWFKTYLSPNNAGVPEEKIKDTMLYFFLGLRWLAGALSFCGLQVVDVQLVARDTLMT